MTQQVINQEEVSTRSFPFLIPDKLFDSTGGLGVSLALNLSASSLIVTIIGLIIGVAALFL